MSSQPLFKFFVRRPFIVTAALVTEEELDRIAAWCGGDVVRNDRRKFILVPVINPKSRKQTEANIGDWVTYCIIRNEPTFKVYTQDYLDSDFYDVPYTNEPDNRACSCSKKVIAPRSLPTQGITPTNAVPRRDR